MCPAAHPLVCPLASADVTWFDAGVPTRYPRSFFMTVASPIVPYHMIAGAGFATRCGLKLTHATSGPAAPNGVIVALEQVQAMGARVCVSCDVEWQKVVARGG